MTTTDIQPVIIGGGDTNPDERIHIFSIDGTDYYMPAHVPASVALQVLDVTRRQGQEAALSYLLETVLGEKAYQALLTCRSLTPHQLKQVTAAIQKHVMGQLEDTTGN